MKKKSTSIKKRKPLKRKKRGQLRPKAVSKRPEVSDDVLAIHVSEYSIVYDPMTDEYSDMVPPEIEKEISEKIYFLAGENPRKAIARLNELRIQYPEHPRIYNFLAKAYLHLRDTKKMIEVIEENYRINPDYLFAKINYAEICLQRGDIHKIPIIFDHKFDLKALYPERDEFHVTEVVAFFGVLGIYFLKIHDMTQAKQMLQVVKDLNPDAEIAKDLERRIKSSATVTLKAFKKLLNIQE
jgi:tetratricopeptide (TPR) repeat protein